MHTSLLVFVTFEALVIAGLILAWVLFDRRRPR
jgi:hypothetical protein